MKFEEALRIINHNPKGYMVNFEHVKHGLLLSDNFPDKHAGEELIATEEEAWALAKKFAAKTYNKCVNIYITDENFSPVPDYTIKMIKNRSLFV
jgi:hypothetical protein